jgi:hypothetical protein
MSEVDCPYCGKSAGLVDSADIYGKSYGMVWTCPPCDAWVGVHKNDGKNRPLGTLANAETRHARKMAHERFDPLWKSRLRKGKSKNKLRGEAYTWLAGHLGIPVTECHIGLFDLKTCVRVIEICVRETYNEAPSAGQRT